METLFTNFLERFLINYVKQIKITLNVLFSTIYQWAVYEPISVQCSVHMETTHLICNTNQATGCYKNNTGLKWEAQCFKYKKKTKKNHL